MSSPTEVSPFPNVTAHRFDLSIKFLLGIDFLISASLFIMSMIVYVQSNHFLAGFELFFWLSLISSGGVTFSYIKAKRSNRLLAYRDTFWLCFLCTYALLIVFPVLCLVHSLLSQVLLDKWETYLSEGWITYPTYFNVFRGFGILQVLIIAILVGLFGKIVDDMTKQMENAKIFV